MFDTPLDDLDAKRCARDLEAVVVEQRRLAARRFALVAHWADTHPAPAREPARAVRPGSDGTPHVHEFAGCELGLLLGTSTVTASRLLRDVLDVRHRLPRLWEAVMVGSLDDWKARAVARATAALTAEQARWVDAEVLDALLGLPYGRARSVVEGK